MQRKTERAVVFRSLSFRAKLDYLYDYYKLRIFLGALALALLGAGLASRLNAKEVALYCALINVSAGERLTEVLTEGYIEADGEAARERVYLYKNLRLGAPAESVDPSYALASHGKILAAVDAEELDLVLADRRAIDVLAQSGYLADVGVLLAESACLASLDYADRLIHYARGRDAEGDGGLAEQIGFPVALELSDSPYFSDAGFQEPVYLGVLANSPRRQRALAYIEYLLR